MYQERWLDFYFPLLSLDFPGSQPRFFSIWKSFLPGRFFNQQIAKLEMSSSLTEEKPKINTIRIIQGAKKMLSHVGKLQKLQWNIIKLYTWLRAITWEINLCSGRYFCLNLNWAKSDHLNCLRHLFSIRLYREVAFLPPKVVSEGSR